MIANKAFSNKEVDTDCQEMRDLEYWQEMRDLESYQLEVVGTSGCSLEDWRG